MIHLSKNKVFISFQIKRARQFKIEVFWKLRSVFEKTKSGVQPGKIIVKLCDKIKYMLARRESKRCSSPN
jgi:hypothetical protein